MKYTFPKADGTQKTVEIEDEWINKTKKALNISSREAIQLWLCDHDYMTNEEQQVLNEKAAKADAGLHVQTKERKKPVRKPDIIKRTLIKALEDFLISLGQETKPAITDVKITNEERIITFAIGEDHYDLTLSKKRKPKA